MPKINLYIPQIKELWYREKLLSDPETMGYNKGYNLGFDGYNNNTGCIKFPKSQWESCYSYFVNNEPERFYAYIILDGDKYIGEVNLHNSGDFYEMGIVIDSKYRGMGYSSVALNLLLDVAFNKLHADEVHNDFKKNRISAVKAHIKAGFKSANQNDTVYHLVITKKDYRKD